MEYTESLSCFTEKEPCRSGQLASEGSDAFDKLISLCKTTTMDTESDMVVKALTEGRRYLKGNYHHHCSTAECDGVADHCLPHALSNPKDPDFDAKCLVTHGKQCTDCDQLSNALERAKILLQSSGLPNERKAEVEYDCNNSIKSIENWKAHILMTINQESAKQEILESLDHETAFIVIDFAMKFLARRYRESMAHWFGKAGMGMHVSCVVIKKAEGHNEESFKKRTYIIYIGKTNQDVGAVMAIYQSVLNQVKNDFPHIKYDKDKCGMLS